MTVASTIDSAPEGEVRLWQRHPVDLRLTVPFVGCDLYLTMVAGPERRSTARRQLERRRHPLRTLGNAVFVLLALAGCYGLFLGAVLAASAVIG